MTEKNGPGRRGPKNVDNRLTDLERHVQDHGNGLEIQFQRIAQLQADVDRLRTEIFGAEHRHAAPGNEEGPRLVPGVINK